MKSLYLLTMLVISVWIAGMLWIGFEEGFEKQSMMMLGIGGLLIALLFIVLYKRKSIMLKHNRIRIQLIDG